jgi:hypothetical protein
VQSPDRIELEIPTELSVKDIKSVVESSWTQARTSNPELRKQLRDADIDPDTAEFPFLYEQHAGALGTTLLLLAGTLAIKLTFKAANDIWDKILLPALIRKYGEDARKWKKP